MLVRYIEDIKLFMNQLLKDVTFDEFEVISMELTQLISHTLDGYLTEKQEDQLYIKWLDLKPVVFQIIKGNKTPTSMKIAFSLSQKNKNNLVLKCQSPLSSEDINGFYLNILFENNTLKIVTGTNYKTFTLDKTLERYFDDTILRFFSKHEIPLVEELNQCFC